MTKIVTTHIENDEPVRTEHEIDAKNFCVIVHQQGLKVEVPEFVEVDPQDTIRCMSEMTQPQWEWISQGPLFKHLWQEAFDPSDRTDPPKSIEVLNMGDMGLRHMAGMIVLGCEACMAGKSVFFRNPETYLHPKTERYVATMLHKMLDLFGGGEVKTTTADSPPQHEEAYLPSEEDLTGDFNDDVVGEIKRELEEQLQVNRESALRWLKVLRDQYGPEKEVVQQGNTRLTVEQVKQEIENDTDVGRWFIEQFVTLRDGA